jgi:S-formylglutathione hydrolase FrmB
VQGVLRLPVDLPWLVVALFAVAAALWRIGWRLRRSVRHRRAVIALAAAVLVAVAAGADIANIHFAYMPRAGDVVGIGSWRKLDPAVLTGAMPGPTADSAWAGQPTGGVVTLPIPDPVSKFGYYRAQVYLPPQYLAQPTRRFPVLYLLHGAPGVPVDWLRGGQATAAADAVAAAGHPMILVMPRDSRWWLDDSECVDGTSERSDTYVTADVVRAVDATLRTVPDRAHRAVGGMSAGGYCALNLGLRHRDTFAAIVDMSGLTKPTHAGGLGALFGSGPEGRARTRANTPAAYVDELAPTPPMAVWMDAGTSDGVVLTQMQSMAAALRQLGYSVRLGTRPGAHTFHVWAPALRDALPWVAGQLGA